MMYGKHDLKVRNPLEREPIKGAPHGDEVLKRYRLKRDEHENSIYVEAGEENIQEYVNSFANGCSLNVMLDRIRLMPVHDKISYLQQTEQGVSADITNLPTDGTEAQIMLMKLKQEHPEIVERMRNGETFDKVLSDLMPKETTPAAENTTITEENVNG